MTSINPSEISIVPYYDVSSLHVTFPGGPISDDTIIALLRNQMKEVDSQISDLTRQLFSASNEAKRLAQEAQKLNAIREFLSREPYMNTGNGELRLDASIEPAALRNLENRLGLSPCSLGAGPIQVRELLERVQINGENLAGITHREGLQLRAEGLSEKLRECNAGNELGMIRLQSLMQQRTQLVQLASNTLKALDEGRDLVVGNLR
ncbi:MAG: hypothetical protein NZM37_01610 [Sandaracinaceae bacterium]|nr:hypothetical protein [Sandaracinaceae bacterium]MDW8245319.1 hypothetical protein [Sandaracinaceae bacterium]